MAAAEDPSDKVLKTTAVGVIGGAVERIEDMSKVRIDMTIPPASVVFTSATDDTRGDAAVSCDQGDLADVGEDVELEPNVGSGG